MSTFRLSRSTFGRFDNSDSNRGFSSFADQDDRSNSIDVSDDQNFRPRDFDSPAFPSDEGTSSVLGFPPDQQFGQPPQQTTEDPFRRLQVVQQTFYNFFQHF